MTFAAKHAFRDRPFLYSVLISVALLLISLAATTIPQSEWTRIVLIDILVIIANALAVGVLVYAARATFTHSKRLAWVWVFLSLAQVSYFVADVIWFILEVILQQDPFPSLADGFYVLYYPLFLFGILLFPTLKQNRTDGLKTTLDMGVVLLASVLGFWNFLIGPIIHAGEDTPLALLLSLAYPVGDILLLNALLSLIYKQIVGTRRGAMLLLSASVFSFIFIDCFFSYQFITETYVSGSPLDVGWIIPYLLTGLAGVCHIITIRSEPASEMKPKSQALLFGRWTMYLPYIFLIGAFILLILSHSLPMPMSFDQLALSVSIIIFFVLVRQIITLAENNRLNSELQNAMDQVKVQAYTVQKANQDLQFEINIRKKAEEQLVHDALHDALTGLPNRVLFIDRLKHAMECARHRKDYPFSVLFLDLDQFKVVNDSLGHNVGDELLIAIAKRLLGCMRPSDTIGRLGGDEFVILMEDATDDVVYATANTILARLKQPFALTQHEIYTSASIGVVNAAADYERPEDILRDADIAMYQAKANGKACWETFHPLLRDQAMKRLVFERELRQAIERKEFVLYYQPILTLGDHVISGFEALIRWQHPLHGLIPPDDFIPIAEETGLIVQIGEWVLNEACRQLAAWQQAYPNTDPLYMNINVSGKQLVHPVFVNHVLNALKVSGVDGHHLRLEITENVCIDNHEAAIEVFTLLREYGIQLQIDDFGTGYSSLGYLQQFPIQTIKIDRSFINKMNASGENSSIVKTIISMAKDLSMNTIAEGIETEDQLKNLKKFGCQFGQGYLLSYPVPQSEIERQLDKQLTKEQSVQKRPPHIPLTPETQILPN
jgi:diguanylate cyclase (GGDEF)-like protein